MKKGSEGGETSTSIMTAAQHGLLSTPTMFEKSIHWIGKDLEDIKGSGVTVFSVVRDYYPSIPELFKPIRAFQEWIADNIGEDVYNLDQGATVADTFNQISSKVLYQMGKGTLTDVIGDYFSYVPGSVRVKVDDTVYEPTEMGTNHWSYDKDAFEVIYDEGAKEFQWIINKPLEKTKYAYFIYDVTLDTAKASKLTGKNTDYHLLTNNSASVAYMTSLEADNGETSYTKSVTLNSPWIGFSTSPSIDTSTFTVEKEWSNPAVSHSDIQVQVYKDGTAYGSAVTLGKSNNWQATITITTPSDATPSVATLPDATPTAVQKVMAASESNADGSLADGTVSNDNATVFGGTYTLREVSVPSGYTVTYSYDSTAKKYTVRNTRTGGSSSGGNGSGGGSSTTGIISQPVPAGAQPDTSAAGPDTEITGNPVPLGGMPKTGDPADGAGQFLLLIGMTGILITLLSVCIRKREE
jgi:hypothetical protein